MQIEQNFRDEKNGRFGFGLRASKSRSTGRILVLSLLATLSTIVMWLLGYHAENKGLHLKYQANSIKSRRVISYLTLAKNVLRHSPLILRRTVLSTVLNHLSRTYRNMVRWFISSNFVGIPQPSRAAIMTGRAPARFGVYSNTDAQDGIPLTETFLPELFQNHGYYTAAVGKWHLSKISNVPVPEDKQTRDYHDNFTTFSAEEWQPQNRGFDYFMGFHAAGTAYYNSPSLFKNREHVPAKGYISDQLTDEAIGVVDRAKTLDQPFMLYLAYNAPHLPNDNPAPDQYQKQFNTGSQTADNYYASVYSVDQGVKRILEQLKKNGQYDNTIILFTSDNGAVIDGPLPLNGAQKGYKSQTYPGGTHTPMFMWWKGKLQPGNYDKLISAMDFYPTALDAADISIPKDLKLDGVSLLPWLQDKKQGEPHKNLTWITLR